MGSCLGHCSSVSDRAGGLLGLQLFNKRDKPPDFVNLVEDGSSGSVSSRKNKRRFHFRLFHKRKECKGPKKPVLELVEEIFNPPGEAYSILNESQLLPSSTLSNSQDIQLQCLDARALLLRTTTSTPASSLDLEWEHENLPLSMAMEPSNSSWIVVPEEVQEETISDASVRNNARGSNSDWSRVSSADSLEWDSVQNSFHASPPGSELDVDTEQLLNEIERLTSEALRETGRGLHS